MTKYCPACDRPYANMEELRKHINWAQSEGELDHIDIADMEGWDETSAGKRVKSADDLEES